MGLFEILMGGKPRQEYEDFARRYDEGPPWEGYSDDEVMTRYGDVAHRLPTGDYEEAVREALSRLSPRQQAELGRYLQERAERGGVSRPPPAATAASGGLDDLVRSVRELHEEPGRLRGVLTRAPSAGEGPAGRAAPAGGDPPAFPAGPGGSIFDSPLAKAAIAGITAMLVRRMLASRR